jgi:hypothetical protein
VIRVTRTALPFDARRAAVTASLLALAVGAGAAPFVFHHYDVVDCFLTWARASAGLRPWAIYLNDFRTNCDYPPVVPYLLTMVERLRLIAGAAEAGGLAVLLLKMPNLLAAAAHGPLAAAGLRAVFGEDAARRAGVLLALSPALFVNAALWGQFDALLTLLVLAAVVALLQGRFGLAGLALGVALSTKLLAVVAVPLALVWTLRRGGVRAAGLLGGAAAAAMLVLAAPDVLAGAGPRVWAAYSGAVDYYPFRTVEAYNGWYLLDRYDIFVRGLAARDARLDTRAIAGAVTHHQVGLALFALYSGALAVLAWKRPAPAAFAWLLVAQFYAFFMLPTQMHQRYVLPAAVLAALVAPLSRRGAILCAALAVSATLNQGLDLGRAVLEQALIVDPVAVADPPRWRAAIRLAATAVAIGNVAAFAWMTAILSAETAPRPEPER